jgi:hypothetical protein
MKRETSKHTYLTDGLSVRRKVRVAISYTPLRISKAVTGAGGEKLHY